FFFQAEDGIRDRNVTGVQTCALPIYLHCCLYVSHSMKQLESSSGFKPGNSSELKPGVSATRPLATENNSTCLVVCFPRPRLVEIPFVCNLSEGARRFRRLDFTAPDWPASTVTSLSNLFLIIDIASLFGCIRNTLYPIAS